MRRIKPALRCSSPASGISGTNTKFQSAPDSSPLALGKFPQSLSCLVAPVRRLCPRNRRGDCRREENKNREETHARTTIGESDILGYVPSMPAWFSDPQASYVLAAYGATGLVFLGLLLFSWRAWRCRKAEWRKTRHRQAKES